MEIECNSPPLKPTFVFDPIDSEMTQFLSGVPETADVWENEWRSISREVNMPIFANRLVRPLL